MPRVFADPKSRPHHREYLKVLRSLSPEARLRKAIELSELTRELFIQGLRRRFPDKTDAELEELARRRLDRCRNQTY